MKFKTLAGDHPPTSSQECSGSDSPEGDFNRNQNDEKQTPSITNGLKRDNVLEASSESSRHSAISSDNPETGSQSDPDPDPDSGGLKKDGNSFFKLHFIIIT